MKLWATVVSVAVVISLVSCASMTPTKEVTEGYRIYDIQGVSNHSSIATNVKSAMQKNAEKVTFTNNIPPNPLPEEPGRFSTVNPFAKSNFSALMAAQGTSLKIPKCDEAIFTATSHDSFEGAENTIFFVCLLPYKNGYHMDVYYTFTKVSGGLSPQAMGKKLAQSLVGDSSQFIPRTIAALEAAAQETGGTVKVVETYP